MNEYVNIVIDNSKTITDFVTLKEGSYVGGSILGRVTTDGEYNLSLSGSADGSEIPRAILKNDIEIATGETKVVVVYLAGYFDPTKLTFGTGHTATTTKDGLREKGIFMRGKN